MTGYSGGHRWTDWSPTFDLREQCTLLPANANPPLLLVASVPASLEFVFLVDFHISHNHRQLLLMDIDSGYLIAVLAG